MAYTFDENHSTIEKDLTRENFEPLKDSFISSIEKEINLSKVKQHDKLVPEEISQENYFEFSNFLSSRWNYGPLNYFSKVQKWVGNVIELNNESFKARLKDLSQNGTDEIGEFDLEEVSPEDLELVKIGAGFYWSVGYANKNGQIKKESILRFQRLSNWTAQEFDKISDKARYFSNNLNWES